MIKHGSTRRQSFNRIAAIAGILFVVTSFVAAIVPGMPPPYDQGGKEIAEWFSENGQRFKTWHTIAGLAFLLFYIPFFAGVCEEMRVAEGEPSMWSRVAWGGALACPVVGTARGMMIMGVAHAGDGVTPEVALFASAASHYGMVVSGALAGVAMLGAAVVIVRTGVFPKWLGWTAAVLGAAAVMSCIAVAESGTEGLFATMNGLAFTAYFLWMLALAIAMLLHRSVTSEAQHA